MMMSGTLYFYKGTAFPITTTSPSSRTVMDNAKEMIALGLRMSNISLDEQAKDYFEQLDIIEDHLHKYCNPSSKKKLKKVCSLLMKDEDELYATWCLNICALLIMKRINNDEMNGLLN